MEWEKKNTSDRFWNGKEGNTARGKSCGGRKEKHWREKKIPNGMEAGLMSVQKREKVKSTTKGEKKINQGKEEGAIKKGGCRKEVT